MLQREWTLNSSDIIALEFQRNSDRWQHEEKETRLHQIKRIEDYSKINRPIISKDKRVIIEEKLDLEKMAEKRAKSRTKNEDQFLKYNFNPLSQKENVRANHSFGRAISASQSKIYLKPLLSNSQMSANQVSLIDALHKIKDNHFRRDNRKLLKISKSSIHISSKNCHDAKSMSMGLQAKQKSAEGLVLKQEELSFEQILQLPDKNYYSQNQGPINIFEFMQGNNRSILTNDILLKYHFNFTSSLDKLTKYKIYIFRELSRLGRSLVFKLNMPRSTRLDVLSSYEMSISLKDIRFTDLISVSSGRLDSSLIYSIIYEGNAQKDNSPSSSMIDDDYIPYLDTHHQKLNNYDYSQDFNQERIQYLALENSPYQARCIKKYQGIYKNVEGNVQQVKKIYKNTIKDSNLHKKYEKRIQQDVLALADLDQHRKIEPDKLIRQNKRSKNRQQRLKIRQLLNTISINNNYRQLFGPLLDKSKPK